jgi:hypothetical protein
MGDQPARFIDPSHAFTSALMAHCDDLQARSAILIVEAQSLSAHLDRLIIESKRLVVTCRAALVAPSNEWAVNSTVWNSYRLD